MTDLFLPTPFVSHSGITLPFKIDCDALTDGDLATLAKLVADRIAFSRVVGVPRGGLRFAAALCLYGDSQVKTNLIVDDVLTTGRSMSDARRLVLDDDPDTQVVGVVIFARTVCPHWVNPIFSLDSWVQP